MTRSNVLIIENLNASKYLESWEFRNLKKFDFVPWKLKSEWLDVWITLKVQSLEYTNRYKIQALVRNFPLHKILIPRTNEPSQKCREILRSPPEIYYPDWKKKEREEENLQSDLLRLKAIISCPTCYFSPWIWLTVKAESLFDLSVAEVTFYSIFNFHSRKFQQSEPADRWKSLLRRNWNRVAIPLETGWRYFEKTARWNCLSLSSPRWRGRSSWYFHFREKVSRSFPFRLAAASSALSSLDPRHFLHFTSNPPLKSFWREHLRDTSRRSNVVSGQITFIAAFGKFPCHFD